MPIAKTLLVFYKSIGVPVCSVCGAFLPTEYSDMQSESATIFELKTFNVACPTGCGTMIEVETTLVQAMEYMPNEWKNISYVDKFGQLHKLLEVDGNFIAATAVHTQGIYKSEDKGLTWKYVGAGSDNQVWDIVQASDLTLYAVTEILGNVWKSVDNGDTWTLAGTDSGQPIAIAIVEGADGSLNTGGFSSSFRRSVDGGQTWANATGTFPGFVVLHAFKDSLDNLYMGGIFANTISKSTDNGVNWVTAGAIGVTEISTECMAEDSSGNLYTGSYPNAKLWQSVDKAANWTLLYDFSTWGNRVRAILITPTDKIYVCVDQSDMPSKVFESLDGGSSFHEVFSYYTITNNPFYNTLMLADDSRIYGGATGFTLSPILRSPVVS